MQTLSTTTTLTTTGATTDSQKAWHILSVLLSIGRPTPPEELASRCTLFPVTPDLVLDLCFMPTSPISLTYNPAALVTVSVFGLFSLARFLSNFELIPDFSSPYASPRILMADGFKMYFRKRKRVGVECGRVVDEEDGVVSGLSKRSRSVACNKECFQMSGDIIKAIHANQNFSMPVKPNNFVLTHDLFSKTMDATIGYVLKDVRSLEGDPHIGMIGERREQERILKFELIEEHSYPLELLDNYTVYKEDKVDETGIKTIEEIDATFCPADCKLSDTSTLLCGITNRGCNAKDDLADDAVRIDCKEEEFCGTSKMLRAEINFFHRPNVTLVPQGNESKRLDNGTVLVEEPMTSQVKEKANFISPNVKLSPQKQTPKPSPKTKISRGVKISSRKKATCQSLELHKIGSLPNRIQQSNQEHMRVRMPNQQKQKHDNANDRKGSKLVPSDSTKIEPKEFESYVVETEEGSGGYGTVYKARRKSDGTIVAIKCPHANAHRHYITNELRMLQRFGGKNFIIKFEGHLKSGEAECFVLQHVEHDRPEVLKKEIDVFHLRWYAYCLFKALASLHKQGIVHRDVKPGNFLFSCKTNKGYLIDFNLAMDMHQKHGTSNKVKVENNTRLNNVPIPNAQSISTLKSRRLSFAQSSVAVNQETRGLKPAVEPRSLKRTVTKTKARDDLGGWNTVKSQGTEGSGVTSVKDVTSARTTSAERLREPLPCQGRKELISLVHEAMQSPNHVVSSIPSPMRKRIVAPPGQVDGRDIYFSPMPLHPIGSGIAGSDLSKHKGTGKQRREGPCVGTKGFRAPEVLFRSIHQGPKVDVWSAGVTLLYLIIGKAPFYGDPEQNIRDIAKLRSSEDLWEVSKLHDREASFPVELYKPQLLPSMTLQNWCKTNTKRPNFLDAIPSALIDLVDKCLTVNPRLRISSEDALKHEFFAPCIESLKKQRLIRQGLTLHSNTSSPLKGPKA